jgi:hypothetical protein
MNDYEIASVPEPRSLPPLNGVAFLWAAYAVLTDLSNRRAAACLFFLRGSSSPAAGTTGCKGDSANSNYLCHNPSNFVTKTTIQPSRPLSQADAYKRMKSASYVRGSSPAMILPKVAF